ncbi:MAG: CPBP family intramembrane metalloprotease [Burkholderiaceae bacterium]|nr:CPBP family intramembrane metalloprotease [Burkholderiaceae bacterium]
MTSDIANQASATGWTSRLWRAAPIRIIAGALLCIAPVAFFMAATHALIDKPYRQVWPFVLSAVLCLGIYRWFAQTLEKRTAVELARNAALREFALGSLMGLALICAVTFVLWTAGVVHFEGAGNGGWLNPLAEMLLAATLEEVVFRAVLFRILADWLGARIALVVSALLFGLAHFSGDGFSLFAFAGVTLAGVLLTSAFLRTGRLWLPIGLHFGWNFTSVAVFGYATSGNPAQGMLRTTLAGPDWLTGGAFGVEASAVTLIAIALLSAALLALPKKRMQPATQQESHA